MNEGVRMILAVGRLSQEKGQIVLLRAFKKLNETHDNTDGEIRARLVIVGDGPERETLEAATASLGLSDRVVFTGQVNNPQAYFEAADVLVNPSDSEGSPYVLLEAMAAGLPIVATAVGGVPELLENNESALLVPAGDPQAMFDAIARVLNDERLAGRLTKNAGELVSTRLSPEAYVRSLAQVYSEVISSH
jgi:glycosyltransferase involved in cell wall biosynthesis